MADITRLSRLLAGVQRQVDISTNTLVVDNLKVKMGSGNDANHATFSGSLTAARTITMPDTNVALADIATNKTHVDGDGSDHANVATNTTFNTNLGLTTNGNGASKVGIEDTATQFTSTNVEGALTESLDAAQASQATADAALPKAGGTMAGAIAMGSSKITGLADGTAASDAATKGQVDAALNGISWKNPADLATTADITLSGEQTIDGTLTSTSRVLVKNQGTGSENGLYTTAAGAWTRTSDMDGGTEADGAAIFILDGAANADKGFTQTTDPVTIGSTAQVWSQFTTAGALTASLGVERVSSDFRLDLLASGGLKLTGNEVGIEPADFAGTGLEDDGSDNLRISTGAAGTGLTGGGGSALSIAFGVSGSVAVSATDLASTANAKGASLIGVEDTAGNFTATDVEAALAELASSAADIETMQEDLVAGETLTAGLKALRWARAADAGFVAGRVYLADKDASSSDDFYVMGIVTTAGETISTAINNVVKSGKLTATSHGFTVGEPIFLSSTGGLTNTAPTAADEAVVRVGMARDANIIEVQIQVIAIN